MRVVGLVTVAVVDDHQPAVSAQGGIGIHHHPVSRGVHGCAGGRADIHAFMERAFTREGIGAVPKRSHQAARHGKSRGLCERGLQALGGAAHHGQDVGGTQEVVILHAFGETGNQLAFAGNIGRAFQPLADAISYRNFLGIQLQAGELLVGAGDFFLQALIARAKPVSASPRRAL